MNREQMQIFTTLVRTRSIKETAIALGIDEFVISGKLQQLENNLGFDLIKRGKGVREIMLSEKGWRFYALSPKIIALLAEIEKIKNTRGAQQPHSASPR